MRKCALSLAGAPCGEASGRHGMCRTLAEIGAHTTQAFPQCIGLRSDAPWIGAHMTHNGKPRSTNQPVGSRQRKRIAVAMEIPINLERVLLRAARDASFCQALKSDRDRALQQCDYDLRPTELAMLSGMPWDALQKMIERFQPDRLDKSQFAKRVAAAVASSVLLSTAACDDSEGPEPPASMGVVPDWPSQQDSGPGGAGGAGGAPDAASVPIGGSPAGVGPDWPAQHDSGTAGAGGTGGAPDAPYDSGASGSAGMPPDWPARPDSGTADAGGTGGTADAGGTGGPPPQAPFPIVDAGVSPDFPTNDGGSVNDGN